LEVAQFHALFDVEVEVGVEVAGVVPDGAGFAVPDAIVGALDASGTLSAVTTELVILYKRSSSR